MTLGSLGVAVGADLMLAEELAASIVLAARDVGVDARRVATSDDARGVDLVLGVSYPSWYPPLWDRSLAAVRAAWIGEPLPRRAETAGQRLLRHVPLGRVLDATIGAASAGGRLPTNRHLRRAREGAAEAFDRRFNLRAHREAARAGVRLVVSSRPATASLRRWSIDAPAVPFGYHSSVAGDLVAADAVERDIDVLVLGTALAGVPTRRARITATTLAALDPALNVVVVSGGLWRDERTALLRRTRVVLDVHRIAGNFAGIRLLLAAAAGAVVVTEPIDDPYPFVPGDHYVEVPTDDLAAAVANAVHDDHLRRRIVAAAQALLGTDLAMSRSVERLVAALSWPAS